MNADRYVVVGNPVAHSLSPEIHRRFADQCKQEIVYEKQLIEPGKFGAFLETFRTEGKGMNVTVPFKQDAFAAVDSHDELAAAAGAVNTIDIRDGIARGYNTDGIGLVRDLVRRHHIQIERRKVLIIGAGGATQGVLGPLLENRPGELWIANRTRSRADDLAASLGSDSDTRIASSGLEDAPADADLVINATAAGHDRRPPEVDPDVVRGSTCYDMNYGAAATFMVWAQDEGAVSSVDGLGMLVEQAACAFTLWRGVEPVTDPVLEEVRALVEARD